MLNQCERLALEAGWLPCKTDEPSFLRIRQNTRLSRIAEGAGLQEDKFLFLPTAPNRAQDLALFKRLAETAHAIGLALYAVPADVASILILAHCKQFDSRFFTEPFKPEIMSILDSTLKKNWQIA